MPQSSVLPALAEELGVEMRELFGDDEEEAARVSLTGDQRDMLAALALALEPFRPTSHEAVRT